MWVFEIELRYYARAVSSEWMLLTIKFSFSLPGNGFNCGIMFILTNFQIPFFNADLTKE